MGHGDKKRNTAALSCVSFLLEFNLFCLIVFCAIPVYRKRSDGKICNLLKQKNRLLVSSTLHPAKIKGSLGNDESDSKRNHCRYDESHDCPFLAFRFFVYINQRCSARIV